jgi:hypothetical protein
LLIQFKDGSRRAEIRQLRKTEGCIEDYLNNSRKQNYTSTHFDTPNYVAHMRLNERVDAKGKQGLFIEELQSDRHQQGGRKATRASQS